MHSPHRTLAPLAFTALVLFGFQGSLKAQQERLSVDQWEVVELDIRLSPSGDNPFDRLPLAECHGPSGKAF